MLYRVRQFCLFVQLSIQHYIDSRFRYQLTRLVPLRTEMQLANLFFFDSIPVRGLSNSAKPISVKIHFSYVLSIYKSISSTSTISMLNFAICICWFYMVLHRLFISIRWITIFSVHKHGCATLLVDRTFEYYRLVKIWSIPYAVH